MTHKLRSLTAATVLIVTATAAGGNISIPASHPGINYMGRIHWNEKGYGADYHPSKLQSQKMADELTTFLTALIAKKSD